MYNIHSHYHNLFSYLKTIIAYPKLVYLYPFGASSANNVEVFDVPNSNDLDPVIFCYDQEPLLPGYNDFLFKFVKHNVAQGRPVILLNTEADSEAKKYFLEKFGMIDAYCFFHIFAAHDWFRGSKFNTQITPITKRTIKKKFITFNRLTGSARVYRSLFVAELSKQNLLEHGHVSYSDNCPDHGPYVDNLTKAISDYKLDMMYIADVKNQLDTIDFPLRIDHKEKDAIPNHSMVLSAVPECMDSFLYVVTETCFWEKKKHLTEKIFKPILLKQPFALLGCAHNLEYLRSYGFKTFDRWIDESYDHIEDPVERIKAVTEVIKYISSLPNWKLEQMLAEMEEVLEYNYQLFNSKEFLDAAWSELTDNLKSAIDSAPAELVPYALVDEVENSVTN
jgi:hypothetical protein